MTRSVIPGTIVIVGLIVAWCCSPEPAPAIEKVSDNLFVITGGDAGNTAVFVRAEGVVLVDTRVAGSGQRILDLVRTVTDRPITHILNTHTHFDHVGSNAFFAPQVEVVAHENTAGQMTEMAEFRDDATKHGLPDLTFKDRLTLFPGADAIDLYYFGAAHTNGDAFIVFRSAGVMHAGDTFPGFNVVASNGGSADEYPKTMGRAAAGITGVHTVIPGHGTVATWQSFVDNSRTLSGKR
jgi:cyclase